MSRIVVLGCGAVGKYIAIDLCKNPNYEVVSVDINQEVLEDLSKKYPIQTRVVDLSSAEGVTNAVEDADIVIGSVPYSIGYEMLKNVIRAGKNIVDISYFMEDPFTLDDLAKEYGVIAVVDCGVVPGMGNIILGDHSRKMKIDRYECYVGGVPKSKTAPLGYKSPFPVLEVLEEYAESGTMVEDGEVVVKPMLDETMTVELDKVGTLACLNSDGLRTLIQTMDIPNMFEKTLRYPNHVKHMRILQDIGFLEMTAIKAGDELVRPIDVTASLLEKTWRYEQGEADLTVMQLRIKGVENGEEVTYTYDMYDEYDPVEDVPSMARTTGYTCNAVVQLILDGQYQRKGICPPEFIGQQEGCWKSVERYLENRGVNCTKVNGRGF